LFGLAVVETPATLVITAGKVRCFHKRPSQVAVAAFAVVLAFLLAVALETGRFLVL
jgi:hypothetical protein